MGRTLAQIKKDNFQNFTKEEIESFKQMISTLHEAVKSWPEQYREGYEVFLKHYGWHMGLWMHPNELIPYIKQGDDAVNRYFIKKLRWSSWNIKFKACRRFPHRRKMISEAFNAHWLGNHFASIPLFLILSEGIFREMSGGDLFSKKSNTKKPTQKEDFINNLKSNEKVMPLMAYIVEAVVNGDVISLRFDNGDYLKYPNVLSRNKILHGADYEYNNKTNAFKALSQFEFVIDSVYLAVKDMDKDV
jgi:hypothetical protein